MLPKLIMAIGRRGVQTSRNPVGCGPQRTPLNGILAEGVGFEPTREREPPGGFQDRCLKPLGHPSLAMFSRTHGWATGEQRGSFATGLLPNCYAPRNFLNHLVPLHPIHGIRDAHQHPLDAQERICNLRSDDFLPCLWGLRLIALLFSIPKRLNKALCHFDILPC